MSGSCFAERCRGEAARRFWLSLPPIPACVAGSGPSLLPDPSLSSAEVWGNIGPGQGHPADELVLSHGTGEDQQ